MEEEPLDLVEDHSSQLVAAHDGETDATLERNQSRVYPGGNPSE